MNTLQFAEIASNVTGDKDAPKILTIADQCIFPIYGMSGGVSASFLFYLRKGNRCLGVRITSEKMESANHDDVINWLSSAREQFSEKSREVNWNGGDLGVGDVLV
jgi:hypothetical protein